MSLKFFQNYIDTMSDNPDNTYRGLMQASIDDQWDNTTQLITVFEQNEIGGCEYHKVEVHVDYAVEMGTGFKQDDDFKIFAFRDLDHRETKGLLYQYDDDYWIVINTSTLGAVTSDIMVRRCNNVMRWVDKINGKLYEYPCAIEYVLESPQQLKDKDVITANGHITVICQGDNITRYLEKNTRFIFNRQPYKLVAYQNMLNEGIKDNMASNLLYLDCYLDMEEPDDNLIDGIANQGNYDYKVQFGDDIKEQVKGYKGKLPIIVTLNGDVVDRECVYCYNENISIDKDGNFELIGDVGSVAKVIGYIEGNEDLTCEIEIKIVDQIADYYELRVSPIINTLKAGKTVEFTANLYKNGAIQPDDATCVASGLSEDYYSLVKNGNKFTLKALTIAPTPLTLTFTSGGIDKTFNIALTSVF